MTSVNWNPADPERSFCNLRPGFPACNERGLVALSVERDHLREGGQVERKTLPRLADREVDRRVELEEQPREALLLGEALAAGDVVEHSAQSGHYPDVAAPVLQAGLQAVRVGVGRVMVGVDRVDDALRVGEEIDRQLFRAGVIAAEVV